MTASRKEKHYSYVGRNHPVFTPYIVKPRLGRIFHAKDKRGGIHNNALSAVKGAEAGSPLNNSKKYCNMSVVFNGKRKTIRRHQLIWLYCYGYFPEKGSGFEIDHIDMVKNNDKISNLRIVTKSDNARNRMTTSQSGFKFICDSGFGWLVRYTDSKTKKTIRCGYASTLEKAVILRNKKVPKKLWYGYDRKQMS